MACEEFDLCTDRAPLFIGINYLLWSIRMESYLKSLELDFWKSAVIGYTHSKRSPNYATKKKLKMNNLEMNVVMEGLVDSMKEKVRKCISAKDIWDKLKIFYMMEEVIIGSKKS